VYSNPSTSLTIFQASDFQRTSITSENTYKNYAFTNTGITYTLSYTFYKSTTINVLEVGGGGIYIIVIIAISIS